MRHTANELIYQATILGPDAVTVLGAGACGVRDLSGRILEQAQLIASTTTHLIVMRALDAITVTDASYITCDGTLEGVLFIVDHAPLDPRIPRPGMWAEIYCHVERTGQ